MGDKTGISWTDATWNPIRGCSRVSAGCTNCYAETMAGRFSDPGQPYHGLAKRVARDVRQIKIVNGEATGDVRTVNRTEARWTGEVRFIAEHLADPLRWKKPRRIFVNSMSDLFHEKLTNEQIAAVFGVMAACPQHTFQVLTKRAKRMREWFEWMVGDHDGAGNPLTCWRHAKEQLPVLRSSVWDNEFYNVAHTIKWPLLNVWMGVSVENQDAADERIPELLRTPAAIRFLSCEPLIGEVDLDMARCDDPHHGPSEWSVDEESATPWCNECDAERSYGHWLHADGGGIDQVIAGCESGPGARPCDVDWLRLLRKQCDDAGVAFFCKQAVHGAVFVAGSGDGHHGVTFGPGSKRKGGGVIELPYLDGVQHRAFPEVTP